MHKFIATYCSQCGGSFGPGDNGYSHCSQHFGLSNRDDLTPAVRKTMEHFDHLLYERRLAESKK